MIDKELIKKFGEETFVAGKDFTSYDKEIIPFSPCLDIILGGGVPVGSVVNLMGKPKCGKTLSALHLAGNAQKFGKPIFYLNVEGRIKSRDLNGIKHLNQDKDKFIVIRSHRGKILTAEEFLTIANNIIHNTPGAVIIVDSVSQLATDKELTNDMGDREYAPGPVLMSQFCKKVSNVVPVNDIIIINILHMTTNMNKTGYGPAEIPSGGKKVQYAADIILKAKYFNFITSSGKDAELESLKDPPIGQKVVWKTESTAIVAPGQAITSYIRYGVGIDEISEIVQLSTDIGLISKSGAWFTFNNIENASDKKFHGQNQLIEYVNENPGIEKILREKVRKTTIG